MKTHPYHLSLLLYVIIAVALIARWLVSLADQDVSDAAVLPERQYHFCPASNPIFSKDFDGYPALSDIVEGDSSLPNINKKFLFVIHVTQDSVGQTLLDRGLVTAAGLKGAVSSAGSYYSRIGIEFEAEDSIYVVENPRFDVMASTAELDENASINAKPNRINMFVVASFEGELLGAAGIAGSNFMHLASSSAGAGTIAHETGHIFTLQHTFGTGDVIASANGEPFETTNELVDGSNCATAGDFVCDTPADPYVANDTEGRVFFSNCIFVYDSTDANGHYYDPEPGNIMSYYTSDDCPCGSFLTDGQLRRVADAYYTSSSRFQWW